MTDSQANITRGISRALGPFLVLLGIAVALKAADMPIIVPAFFQDGVLVFTTAAFTLAIGFGLLAAHHHLGSPSAIIITIFAIVTAIRGALLLLAPAAVASLTAAIVRTPGIVFIPAAVAVLIGLYLSFAGWLGKRAA